MKKIRLVCTAFIFSLITACSGSGESLRALLLTKAVRSRHLLTMRLRSITKTSRLGLKGIDANANGIRDDIDRFIASHYSASSMMKKVAEQEARALQRQVDANTPEQALAAANAVSRAADCTFQSFTACYWKKT